jgi:hypothetical protein
MHALPTCSSQITLGRSLAQWRLVTKSGISYTREAQESEPPLSRRVSSNGSHVCVCVWSYHVTELKCGKGLSRSREIVESKRREASLRPTCLQRLTELVKTSVHRYELRVDGRTSAGTRRLAARRYCGAILWELWQLRAVRVCRREGRMPDGIADFGRRAVWESSWD